FCGGCGGCRLVPASAVCSKLPTFIGIPIPPRASAPPNAHVAYFLRSGPNRFGFTFWTSCRSSDRSYPSRNRSWKGLLVFSSVIRCQLFCKVGTRGRSYQILRRRDLVGRPESIPWRTG